MSAVRLLLPSLSIFSKQSLSSIGSRALLNRNALITLQPMSANVRTLPQINPFSKPFGIPDPPPHQETVLDTSAEDEKIIRDVVEKVNNQISTKSHGRLFAIVHILGKQYKITPEDVLVIEGAFPPNAGDTIRLEKVLLVGSSDFTLAGRPLLMPDLVNIQATVIEKRLSHTKTNFKKKRRKQYMRINFYRSHQTMLRIKSIELAGLLNERKDVEGVAGRIF